MTKMEVVVSYNPALEVKDHDFSYLLFVIQTNPGACEWRVFNSLNTKKWSSLKVIFEVTSSLSLGGC